ncbi:MAG: hypothetical protein LRY73_16235 [Bacillus sp. (in: Bacteria)]|nr:hypothetical protein [Bacillus sp. (in: firmicutes)]
MYWVLIVLVIGQRLLELLIARRNEAWMKGQGALEFGEDHYKWIVLMHGSFFVFLSTEVYYRGSELAKWWLLVGSLFLLVQLMRGWILYSLGPYWNTKILVLPGSRMVKKGPYRWVKHPNYWVVTLELALLPMIFGAYLTAVIFTILNGILLLLIRIPAEEQALSMLSE